MSYSSLKFYKTCRIILLGFFILVQVNPLSARDFSDQEGVISWTLDESWKPADNLAAWVGLNAGSAGNPAAGTTRHAIGVYEFTDKNISLSGNRQISGFLFVAKETTGREPLSNQIFDEIEYQNRLAFEETIQQGIAIDQTRVPIDSSKSKFSSNRENFSISREYYYHYADKNFHRIEIDRIAKNGIYRFILELSSTNDFPRSSLIESIVSSIAIAPENLPTTNKIWGMTPPVLGALLGALYGIFDAIREMIRRKSEHRKQHKTNHPDIESGITE